MDGAVSELDRAARPWAWIVAGVLALFAVGVLAARVLGASASDGVADRGRTTLPPASSVATVVGPQDAAGAEAGSPAPDSTAVGQDSSHGLGPATLLRIYAVTDDQLVSYDLDSGLVLRSPLDFTGAQDGARHLFASQGRVLVWPVGGTGDLVSVRFADGRTGAPEVVVGAVTEAQHGWSLGNVVVRTAGAVAEVAGDGAVRWGPARPPPSVGGRLVGALNQRAVLDGEGGVGSWGPIDTSGPGPALVPASGELVALGADGAIWLDAAAALHMPGIVGDIVIPASDSLLDGRSISGAGVAPDGKVALVLRADGSPSTLVVMDRFGPGSSGETAATASYVLDADVAQVRWSPESRWLIAADRDLQRVVAVQVATGRMFELPPLPVDGPADFTVVRVNRRD